MNKLSYTNPGAFVRADAFETLHNAPPADFTFLDPPYENTKLIREIIKATLSLREQQNKQNAIVCFMWLDDVPAVFDGLLFPWKPEMPVGMSARPDKITVWEKPQSTKNTSKDYSQFLEAICVWHGSFFNKDLHWANRTGIFFDRLIEKPPFAHKKPDTLAERLVKLHTPPGGTVLDLFAGTGTVRTVCDQCGFLSLSSDIDPKF
jgi:hypothetical protein